MDCEHLLSEGKIPSGKLTCCYGKSPFLMGKLTISMAIFNSYVSLPEGNPTHHQQGYPAASFSACMSSKDLMVLLDKRLGSNTALLSWKLGRRLRQRFEVFLSQNDNLGLWGMGDQPLNWPSQYGT